MRIVVSYVPFERTPNEEFISEEVVEQVATSLRSLADEVVLWEYEPESVSSVNAFVVFNLVYGYLGLDGNSETQPESAERMEQSGLQLVGSSSISQRLAQDKVACARVLRNHGVDAPVTLEHQQSLAKEFLIAKPRFGACHRGIRLVRPDEEIELAEDEMLQKFIVGREFTVGVLERNMRPEAFAPFEIKFEDCDPYDAILGHRIPSGYESDSQDRFGLREIAESAFSILQMRDYARFDFKVGEEGPRLIDANALPNLHPTGSFFPRIASQAGVPYEDLVRRVGQNAIQRVQKSRDCNL